MSVKQMTDMEHEYAKMKLSLLSELEKNNHDVEEEERSPHSPMGPEIRAIPTPPPRSKRVTIRERSQDKLESIFCSGEKSDRRLDSDEPFPVCISPELTTTVAIGTTTTTSTTTTTTTTSSSSLARFYDDRRPSASASAGEVYTIREEPEEAAFSSPTTGDGVSSSSLRKERQREGETERE